MPGIDPQLVRMVEQSKRRTRWAIACLVGLTCVSVASLVLLDRQRVLSQGIDANVRGEVLSNQRTLMENQRLMEQITGQQIEALRALQDGAPIYTTRLDDIIARLERLQHDLAAMRIEHEAGMPEVGS